MKRRTPPSATSRSAFTLIELLVVVAIIALLIAILLPSLARARDNAATVACGARMRSVGQAMIGFASEHGDRAPGGGTKLVGANISSIHFTQILNREYFNDVVISGGGMIPVQGPALRGQLGCTNAMRWPGDMPFNGIKVFYWVTNYYLIATNAEQTSGLYFDAAHVPDTKLYDSYWLGAKLSWFESPHSKYMLTESELGSIDSTHGGTSVNSNLNNSPPGSVTIGTIIPAWANADAVAPNNFGNRILSFRHMGLSKANFLMIDGHVEVMGPKDEVSSQRRWNFRGLTNDSH